MIARFGKQTQNGALCEQLFLRLLCVVDSKSLSLNKKLCLLDDPGKFYSLTRNRNSSIFDKALNKSSSSCSPIKFIKFGIHKSHYA